MVGVRQCSFQETGSFLLFFFLEPNHYVHRSLRPIKGSLKTKLLAVASIYCQTSEAVTGAFTPVEPSDDPSPMCNLTVLAWETSIPIKNHLAGRDPDAGEDWGQEEKGETENEMVGWHHQLNEHKFEQTPGDSKGQGSLACFSPRGLKELDMALWLNIHTNTWVQSMHRTMRDTKFKSP